jgi:transketolase
MVTLTDSEAKFLEAKANAIRQTIIEMLLAAGSGHTAGPLGMADIFAALYFRVLQHDPKNPDWSERDRLVLSNGHIVPVRYAERMKLPGLETTSGPLGSGLSQAAGMAYASRMNGEKNRIYCALSDGEHDCGNTWEAAMFAGAKKLSNLTGIIDRNNIQIDGYTESVMPLEPVREKYESFGWHVLEVDGHSIPQFVQACGEAEAIYEKPTVIIAHTIPGKGIREIEGDYRWHGKPPNKEEAAVFLNELRTMQGKITSEHQ